MNKKIFRYIICLFLLVFLVGCKSKKPHEHSYSDAWEANENEHWHTCECGEKKDLGSHTWDSGVLVTPPSKTEKGIKTYTCTVCEHKKDEQIPALTDVDWVYSPTHHWYYQGDDLTQQQYEEHSFDGDLCTICGYHKTMITSSYEWQMAIAMSAGNWTIEEECTASGLEFHGIFKRDSSISYFYTKALSTEDYYLEKNQDKLYKWNSTIKPGMYECEEYEFNESEFDAQRGIPFDNVTENLLSEYSKFTYDENSRTYKAASISVNVNDTVYAYNDVEFAFYDTKLVSMNYISKEVNDGVVQAGPTTVSFTAGNTHISKPWESNLNFYYTETEGGILFTGPKSTGGNEYVVPTEAEIDGKVVPVVGIGENAFTGNVIESLVIPESITSIANSAFDNSNGTRIKKITASSSVIEMASQVNGLEEVVVSSCENGVFKADLPATIKKVTLSEGITEIADDCFYNCDGIIDITLPNSLEKIGKRAFKNCDSLTSITIPNKVKTIQEEAFASCTSLENVTLPNALESIGTKAFTNSSKLQLKEFPSTLKSIGSEAFSGCYFLTDTTLDNELVLPEGLDSLGEKAFMDTGLTKITISNSITSIGKGCFRDSQYLKEVVLGEKIESLSEEMFRNCQSLISVNVLKCTNLTSIESSALFDCKSLKHFAVPNSVTSIGEGAFSGCSSLEGIILPFIGDKADVKGDNTTYPLGYIFGTLGYQGGIATEQKYYDSIGSHNVTYYIPESLESVNITKGDILDGAFLNVHKNKTTSLQIFIDDAVEFVDAYAFINCNCNIRRDLSGALYISNVCIGFDDNISSYVLSSDMHMIAKNAGSGSKLESLTIEEGFNAIICDGAFTRMTELKYLETPLELLELFPKENIGELTITSGSVLSSKVLANFTSLKNLVLPNTITSCYSDAFEGTDKIERLVSPGIVLSYLSEDARLNISHLEVLSGKIPSNAFRNSSKLTELVLTEGLSEIDTFAFENCVNLNTIEFPSSLTKIGNFAFKGCTGLEEINLPSSIDNLGQCAFGNCTNLTKARVMGNAGSNTFAGCAKLEELTLDHLFTNLLFLFGNTYFDNSTGVSIRNGLYDQTYYYPNSLKKVAILQGDITSNILYNAPVESIVLGGGITRIESGFNSSTINLYYDGTMHDWCNITFYSQSCNPMYSCKNFYLNDGNGNYEKVVDLEIPNTVTSIGRYQFYNFDQLQSITIPSSVETIDTGAFNECDNLTIYCEATSKPNTFNDDWNCERPYYFGLKKSDVAEVGEYLVALINDEVSIFSYSGNEQNLEIPSEMIINGRDYPVTKIESNAFANCTFITDLVIPDSVVTINEGAFVGCSEVTSIAYGAKVSLYTIFGSTPTKLTNLVLTSQTSIPYNAFGQCESIVTVTLPNTLKSINSYSFEKCWNLTHVYFEGTIEEWCNVVINGIEANPMKYATHFHSKNQNGEWEEVTRLEGVFNNRTSINQYQFYGFEQLTSIIVPNNIETIGIAAFGKCNNLVELSLPFVGGSKERPSSEAGGVTMFGYIFGAKKPIEHDYEVPEGLTTVTLTGGTYIATSAFESWTSLKTLILPNTMTLIRSNAFCKCSSLESIYIPSSVVTLESYVFNLCSKVVVYAEASSKPSGWSDSWDSNNLSTRTRVVWGSQPANLNNSNY